MLTNNSIRFLKMQKKIPLIVCTFFTIISFSQVGIGTKTPDPSAILDIESTQRGFLPPRMDSASRDDITNPARGLMLYNTTLNCLQVNDGTPDQPSWTCISGLNNGSSTSNVPANGILVSDNFQDGNGNAPFNLQVRNTTANATNWQAVVSNVPYTTIPALSAGNFTLVTIDNGNGTYMHRFTGTTVLGPYAGITIVGGVPSPAGSGTGLTLFIPQ